MHQFLKTILTTTCFTLALTTVQASDDEGGGGVDLSSLFGGGNQSQQPTFSSLLLQNAPQDSMSESTDKLIQIFGTGGTFSFDWLAEKNTLTVGIDYNPKGPITSAMESFRSIENSLGDTIASALQRHFFPEGDYSLASRSKRARVVAQQTSGLKTLLNPKLHDFLTKYPELFGEGGLDEYAKNHLNGAFTASQDYATEESKIDKDLLQKVLASETPLVFTYAFPRTDGICSAKDVAKETKFGNQSRNYVMQQNELGTVSITLSIAQTQETPTLGSRTITSETGLSDVISEFESRVTQTLNRFITAAAMKAGVSGTSGMYH